MNFRQKLVCSLVIVFSVAVVARIAYELFSPLLPALVMLLALGGLFAFLWSRFRL